MEAIIGSIPVDLGLVGVLHEVLDMTHLVEDGGKVLKVVISGAHSNTKILPVIKVPCSRMANNL